MVPLADDGFALLRAVTNHNSCATSRYSAVMVVPLALYLLSFVICFDSRVGCPVVLDPWFAVLAGTMIYVMVGCSCCRIPGAVAHFCRPVFWFALHGLYGELAARSPRLGISAYYLIIAAGGARVGCLVR